LKYGVRSTGEGDIRIEAKQADGRVLLSVTDRGAGIPVADRSRVVERFVRLETSRSKPGAGLGLSLVAAVAHLHGGELLLEGNEPGLRATLSLPQPAVERA